MERQEWEAWLENPVTRTVRRMLKERHKDYLDARSKQDPKGFDNAEQFWAAAMFVSAKAEAYEAICDSLTVAAYDDIFEESHGRTER